MRARGPPVTLRARDHAPRNSPLKQGCVTKGLASWSSSNGENEVESLDSTQFSRRGDRQECEARPQPPRCDGLLAKAAVEPTWRRDLAPLA